MIWSTANRSGRIQKMAMTTLLSAICCYSIALHAQNPIQQDAADPPSVHSPSTPSLAPGKTSMEEARAIWAASNASTIGSGKLAIGGGSGLDGMSRVALDQVILIDERGVDFEGLPVARYAFVDEMLYAITAQLDLGLPGNKGEFKQLSREELESLQKALTRKYGKPGKALKDIFAGKHPNIFIWDLRENELILQLRPGMGSVLTMQNKALAKKVDAYRKAECRKHRPVSGTRRSITESCV